MTQLADIRVPTNPEIQVTRSRVEMAAAVKLYQGAAVMVIRSGTGKGYYAPADDARIGHVVGWALETVDNTGGAAGAKSCLIRWLRPRTLHPFINDSGTPFTKADREGVAYALDDQTATGAVGTTAYGVFFGLLSADDPSVWDANGMAWCEINQSASVATAASTGLSDTAPVDPSSSAASAGSATAAARQDHLHHIALATTSAEGLASAAQITQLSHLAAPTVMLFDLQADQALAANTLAEHACLVVATGDTFSAFYVVADSGLTGDPTNNAVLTIKKRDGAGGGASSMAALTTTANWTAFVPKTFGAVSGGAVAAGSVLTLTIGKGGTGVIVPACKIYGVKAVA